jgi:hypothetical protein
MEVVMPDYYFTLTLPELIEFIPEMVRKEMHPGLPELTRAQEDDVLAEACIRINFILALRKMTEATSKPTMQPGMAA